MNNELFTKIDNLGALLAQIADLTKQADQIKDELKDAATLPGADKSFDGAMFKATVVSTDRKSVDYKKMITDLGIAADTLAKYTSTTAVFSVKVTTK
jgi:hypothetical protein